MLLQLKKYLTYVLVFCTLGYGSAWAYDIHTVDAEHLDASDHLIPVYVNNNDHASGQTETTTVCDHSCHAFSHMLAIAPQNICSFNYQRSRPRADITPALVSLVITPDRKPPRV